MQPQPVPSPEDAEDRKYKEEKEDLESDTENRHMNDLEYGRYTALQEVIEIIDELKD